MSLDPILPSGYSLTSVQPATPLLNQTINHQLWHERLTQNGFCGLTTTEITRLSTRILGIGAMGTGVSVIAAAALGFVTWPISLLAIPCALGAASAIWYSFQLDDYENPEELAKFRDDAARMSLEQVMQAYGWNNVLRWGIITPEQFTDKYRQQMREKNLVKIIDSYENAMRNLSQHPYHHFDYHVPAPSEWSRQWRTETATKTFEEIIQTYPLDKLERYNLLEVGELQRIKDLKRDYEIIKGHYDEQVAQVEREFQNNTQIYQRNYQSECAQANQLYNDNWAVRRLKVFEIEYIRERQTVQEMASRRKSEARSRFDRTVATITNNGQIPYDRLLPQDKALYDQQTNELQLSNIQAEDEARLQIANIDFRCIGERSRLNSEESRARGERDRMVNEAKGRYDTAVYSHHEHKERRLGPINSSFRSAVNDLNGRYRAYLRTIGIIH
jgi:hypothetical protein